MLIYVCVLFSRLEDVYAGARGQRQEGSLTDPHMPRLPCPLVPASGKPWPSVLDRALALTGPQPANNPRDIG